MRERVPWSFIAVMLMAIIFIGLIISCNPLLLRKHPYMSYLGTTESGYPTRIAWSPIGNKIAVTAYSDTKNISKIYILDVETQEYQQILGTSYGIIVALGWSPDGKNVIFSSEEGTKEYKPGIWLYDIERNTPPEYLSGGYSAAWSPFGDSIAIFEIARESSSWDISLHVHSSDLSRDEILYQAHGKYIYGLSWSPDGQRLVFAFSPEGRLDAVNIYVLDVASRKITQMTSSGRNLFPVWSPRGNVIAYVIEESENKSSLYLQNLNNGCGQVVPDLTEVSNPTWSPDGKYIAFIHGLGGVYKLDLSQVFGESFIANGLTCP